MGKLTIGSFSTLVGSLSMDFVVKLADAAVKKGHKVDLWVSGNGVTISHKGQKSFRDYSFLQKTIQDLIATGNFQITACEA